MGSSRRELLQRGLVLIGGAVGIGSAARVVSRVNANADGATAAGTVTRSLTFRAQGLRASTADVEPGMLPGPGQRSIVAGELLGRMGGTGIGQFYSTSFGVPHVAGAKPDTSSLELHTFVLKDGTIMGSGTATSNLDTADTFAIIGGTGLYSSARGTYMATQRPLDLGGDGTAEFRLTLEGGTTNGIG